MLRSRLEQMAAGDDGSGARQEQSGPQIEANGGRREPKCGSALSGLVAWV